ncbi:MAG: vWA domain-containing protein, partial [Promethearchaeia archaeon]
MNKQRLYWELKSLKDIIKKKHEIDPNDRFSVILFSNKTYELKEYFRDYQIIKDYIIEEGEIVGKTLFPLGKAVKSIIREKRKIGQKLFRIIVISDGYIYPKMSNPIKFAKAANDLGIIVDFLRFGKGVISGNILKRVVEITGGNNYYIQDELE